MSREKAKVEGVYEKRAGSGIWYTRLRVNGKLVRKQIGTFKEAKEYIEKARTIRSTGAGVLPTTAKRPARSVNELDRIGGDVTVAELCHDWLGHVISKPREYKDQANPARFVRLIKDRFGESPAASVRPYEIRDWLDTFDRWAPATRNKLKVALSSVYRYGRERDKVQVNPARDVKRDRVDDGIVRFLSPDEENRLRAVLTAKVEECKPHQPKLRGEAVHRICELDVALGTGMRKGEQYGLQWTDVDLGREVITLRNTKNGQSREVHLITDVLNALRTLETMSDDVFTTRPRGYVFRNLDPKKWWEAALKEAEIKDFRWHDLRHTFCSRLAQNGAHMKVIQEAAGHKTIAMSARYAHMDKSSLRSAMAVLNRSTPSV